MGKGGSRPGDRGHSPSGLHAEVRSPDPLQHNFSKQQREKETESYAGGGRGWQHPETPVEPTSEGRRNRNAVRSQRTSEHRGGEIGPRGPRLARKAGQGGSSRARGGREGFSVSQAAPGRRGPREVRVLREGQLLLLPSANRTPSICRSPVSREARDPVPVRQPHTPETLATGFTYFETRGRPNGFV